MGFLARPSSLGADQDGGKDRLYDMQGRTRFVLPSHLPPSTLGKQKGTFASLVRKNLFLQVAKHGEIPQWPNRGTVFASSPLRLLEKTQGAHNRLG